MLWCRFFILKFILMSSAWAVVQAPVRNVFRPQKGFMSQGAVSGGLAGGGFTMLKATLNKQVSMRSERIVFDIGDLKGNKMTGLPGYYHAQLVQNPPQLILDFSQMPNSRVFENELIKSVRTSDIIASAKLVSDPIDRTLTVIFPLKRTAQMRVLQVIGKKETSKVVLDLM